MADGIAKGVGEQLGSLGKQIVTDVAKAPSKIVGLDETIGQGTGGSAKQSPRRATAQASNNQKSQEQIAREDEIEKQKQLAEARRLLEQFTNPSQSEPSIRERIEMEEVEERKKEIGEEKKKAQAQLWIGSSKRRRGDLYGRKAKQFGGEVGKNVKAG